jgi:hypothetical protein
MKEKLKYYEDKITSLQTDNRSLKQNLQKIYKDFKHTEDTKKTFENENNLKWEKFLLNYENKNLDLALRDITHMEDDMYMLRAVYKIIDDLPYARKLPEKIILNVLKRVNMISKSHSIQELNLKLIKIAFEYEFYDKMGHEEKNEILDILFNFSSLESPVGKESAKVYTLLSMVDKF